MNRNFTSKINWILDNLLPPILRDSRWFMYILMYPLFKKKTDFFLTFKDNLNLDDENELVKYYKLLNDVHIKRDTDLNEKSIQYILQNITGDKILDIACGTGYLTKKIALSNINSEVVGMDFNLDDVKDEAIKNLSLQNGSILDIPVKDKYFDTVICAHTLEHLYNPKQAMDELRRTTNKKLIIVLPKQREYKYTFDLHLHFYPYKYTLYSRLGIKKDALVLLLDNDYLIVEDYN